MSSVKHRVSNVLAWTGFPFLPFITVVLLGYLSFMITASVIYLIDPRLSPSIDCHDFDDSFYNDIDLGQISDCYIFSNIDKNSKPFDVREFDWMEITNISIPCRDDAKNKIDISAGDLKLEFCHYMSEDKGISDFLRGPSSHFTSDIRLASAVFFLIWLFCLISNYILCGRLRTFPWFRSEDTKGHLILNISQILTWSAALILAYGMGLLVLVAVFNPDELSSGSLPIFLSITSTPYFLVGIINYSMVGNFRVLPWKQIEERER